MSESETNPFTTLLEEADKFCGHIGAGKDIILEIARESSDWAFIIKVDALHETACRDLIARQLTIRGTGDELNEQMSSFVGNMAFNGQSSLIRMVELTGCPPEHIQFLKGVRQVRNAFAHDIRSISESLLNIIQANTSRSHLLKTFSWIEPKNYDEKGFLEMVTKDPTMLRFLILHQTMVMLFLMHHAFSEDEQLPT